MYLARCARPTLANPSIFYVAMLVLSGKVNSNDSHNDDDDSN